MHAYILTQKSKISNKYIVSMQLQKIKGGDVLEKNNVDCDAET